MIKNNSQTTTISVTKRKPKTLSVCYTTMRKKAVLNFYQLWFLSSFYLAKKGCFISSSPFSSHRNWQMLIVNHSIIESHRIFPNLSVFMKTPVWNETKDKKNRPFLGLIPPRSSADLADVVQNDCLPLSRYWSLHDSIKVTWTMYFSFFFFLFPLLKLLPWVQVNVRNQRKAGLVIKLL